MDMQDVEYAMDGNDPISRNADTFGKVLLAIEKRDGSVTPEALLAESQRLKRDHPLRKLLWRDSVEKAAFKYRLSLAADVIRRVKIVLRVEGKAPVTARLFHQSMERGQYQNVERVMSSADTREKLLGQAAQDAEDYRARYRFLRETAEVIDAINSFVAKVKTKREVAKK